MFSNDRSVVFEEGGSVVVDILYDYSQSSGGRFWWNTIING